jgi:uncharacterized protein (TIGR03437 family)
MNLAVTQLQPGIYTVNTSGSGPGIVTNALTGQLISTSNPAHAKDYVTIYCTGLGSGARSEGRSGTGGRRGGSIQSALPHGCNGDGNVWRSHRPVQFAGLTPSLAGLNQINVQLPAGVPAGDAVPLVLTAADPQTGSVARSNSVTVAVR